MTNTQLLKEHIKTSGFRLNFIADKLGLSVQGLLNKIDGKTEFKASEIQGFCELLHLSNREKDLIFFTSLVD